MFQKVCQEPYIRMALFVITATACIGVLKANLEILDDFKWHVIQNVSRLNVCEWNQKFIRDEVISDQKRDNSQAAMAVPNCCSRAILYVLFVCT